MDNYIVRVLRREQTQKDSTAHLDGVVEMVESGTRQAFHSADELWSLLGGTGGMSKSDGGDATTKKDR